MLLIDPLLPPKRCFAECITCSLKTSEARKPQLFTQTNVNNIISSLEERAPKGIKVNGVLVWGCGDPLTLVNIYEVTLSLRAFMGSHDMGRKLYLHTSLLGLLNAYSRSTEGSLRRNIEFLIQQVDAFVVPFLWYGHERFLLGWPQDKNFSQYLELLKSVAKDHEDKLLMEIHVFKVAENIYPERVHLDEVVTSLRHIKVETLVLKPIDRPSPSPRVKPVADTYVERVRSYLSDEGFSVHVDKMALPTAPPQWNKVANVLYNQLLRMPLKYLEVKSIYGDLGIIALNNLLSKNLVSRITWSGEVYFWGRNT